MKKIYFLFLLLITCQLVVAQNAAKDSIIHLISADICEQLKTKDFSDKKITDLEVELGLMMLPIFSKFNADLKKINPDFDFSNTKMLGSLSEEVGIKLAMECPTFLKFISAKPELMDYNSKNKTEQLTLKGVLDKIIPGDFTYMQVKNADGKIEKIWWMEYFEGANNLLSGKIKINKTISVHYVEREIYNGRLKDYVKIKVATSVE